MLGIGPYKFQRKINIFFNALLQKYIESCIFAARIYTIALFQPAQSSGIMNINLRI